MAGKYALLIGNTQYDDSTLSRLTSPSGDVQELASVLRLPDIGVFDDVTTLLNASSDTVRKQIATFFDQKAPDDLLLLYFSGHGVRDDNGKLYFAVRDSQARFLRASAIPASYLSEEMDDTHSKRVVRKRRHGDSARRKRLRPHRTDSHGRHPVRPRGRSRAGQRIRLGLYTFPDRGG